MILYRCDVCGMEMSGADKVSNGWRVMPDGWTQSDINLPGASRKIKIHLCSFTCMNKFEPYVYIENWRMGRMSIKRMPKRSQDS